MVSFAVVGLGGCGDSAQDRAAQLEQDLSQVQGVASVDAQAQSNGLGSEVVATARLSGDLDRAGYERVATAFADFVDHDREGLLDGAATLSVVGGPGTAQVPGDEDDAAAVAGYVERLSGEGDPVTAYEVTWERGPELQVTTDDPMATARRLATGDEALSAAGEEPVRLTTSSDPQEGGGLHLEVELGQPGLEQTLDTVGEAQDELAGSDLSPTLRLDPEGLSVDLGISDDELADTSITPEQVLSTHDDVAPGVCPDLRLTTRAFGSSIVGCVDTQPMHDVLDGLGDVEPTSLRNRDRQLERVVVGLASTEDLATAAEADLVDGDLLLVVKGEDDRPATGEEPVGSLALGGDADERSRLAPVALAAHESGAHVVAGPDREHEGVEIYLKGRLRDPEADFRAIRAAGWDGEVVFGLRSFGQDSSQVRWTSTQAGPATDVGPLAGTSGGDEKKISPQTQALIAAWDDSAS